ncbi:UDP-glucose dehydrogenase family protein [Cohnella cholangitidis]|uniref:UDP-glucose 6-dehydrogenase n=1 Tax=Cohnella cholangitidis TaxID=2598458 RepID=A0A7G5BUZ6_9BACL|nr:UDP-glucose/GDP-mannose dehydrogenase family protein [Cohnella cholangitidis]QMV40780.1 UDP-glucose/GDP-mannose dehydrogenase family protein [Cohnella cholangitidis]
MKILVTGTGYVGTTTALVLSEMGWNVTGLDTDERKIDLLRQGSIPFYEDGLEALLNKQLQSGKLRFTADVEKALQDNDVIFVCVGTPSLPDGSADMQYMKQVAENIGRYMNKYQLIVNKSTVPVGTQEKMSDWIRSAQLSPQPFDVVSNPEFLREGRALSDARYPDRVIIGADNDHAAKLLKALYHSLNCPVIITTPRTAELIKYAANAFLATKISFINEIAELCDRLDVNVKEVAQGIGLDPRIGLSFLHAGIGYGGSCFPKDVAALLRTATEQNTELSLLEKVISVNRSKYLNMLDKARNRLGNLENKKVAVLGLAFKPDTDDIREAPAIRIIRSLLEEKAHVSVHDPVAKLPPDLAQSAAVQCLLPEQALIGADAVLLCTEWNDYQHIGWERMKKIMNRPNVFDGRNMLSAKQMKAMGYHYEGIGYR